MKVVSKAKAKKMMKGAKPIMTIKIMGKPRNGKKK
jgi:hypothetical protein